MPEVLTNPTFIEQLAQKLRAIGSLKAVGDTWISFDSSVPPGGVPFCGQEVTRALYADLWAWAQAQGKVKTELEWQEHAMTNGGNCPYYSSGNGSTTFRMPCVVGYLKGANVTTEGGTYKPQKLPMPVLKKYLRCDVTSLSTPGATDKWGNDGASNGANSGGTDEYMIDMDYLPNETMSYQAEIEEGIYSKNCDKVTPETYQVLVGVYAVGVIQNINNTDVSQLQTGLATLEANTVKSVNNVTPTNGNVEIPNTDKILGLPNKNIVSVSAGNKFTAEHNGQFYCLSPVTGGNMVSINGTATANVDSYSCGSFPVKTGDVITTAKNVSFCYFSYTDITE